MQISEKRKDSVGINGIYIFVFRKNFKQKIKHRNRRDKMIRKKESLINEIKNKCTAKRINKAKFGWTKKKNSSNPYWK